MCVMINTGHNPLMPAPCPSRRSISGPLTFSSERHCGISSCCSVPQLNTLRVTQYVKPTHVQVVHRVRGLRVRLRRILFLFPENEVCYVRSLPSLKISPPPTYQGITTCYCIFSVLASINKTVMVAIDRGSISSVSHLSPRHILSFDKDWLATRKGQPHLKTKWLYLVRISPQT